MGRQQSYQCRAAQNLDRLRKDMDDLRTTIRGKIGELANHRLTEFDAQKTLDQTRRIKFK